MLSKNNKLSSKGVNMHSKGNSFFKLKILWVAACCFYSFQLILRVFPNILIDQLSTDFALTACEMGMLSSAYYNAYACVQIPAGILLDKFNVRSILITSLSFCITGGILFSLSTNVYIAYFARFMTGCGAGFALLSSIKSANLVTQHPKKLSFMIGGNFSMAMILVGFCAPFINAIAHIAGWRNSVLVFSGIIMILLIAAIYAKTSKTAPQGKSHATRQDFSEVLSIVKHNCKKVFKNKQLYILSFYGFCTYIPLSCFCDLWGSKFLNVVYGVEYGQAVSLCMTVYLGIAVGSVFWPYVASIIKSYKLILIFAEVGVVIGFSTLVLWRPFVDVTAIYILLFLLGLSSASTLLAFGVLSNLYGKGLAATANGVYNLCAMMSGVVFQPVIGKIIDYSSAGRNVEPSDFINAFMIFCFLPLLAIISTLFLKIKYKEVNE